MSQSIINFPTCLENNFLHLVCPNQIMSSCINKMAEPVFMSLEDRAVVEMGSSVSVTSGDSPKYASMFLVQIS